MDLQLKRVLEVRRNDCRKVINFINSVNFTSLDDKQIRTLVMIRELGSGIVNRHQKLATEDDVSRTLKLSIQSMARACRKIVEQISKASFDGASEKEKEVFVKILEIARGIADMQGPSAVNLCGDLNVPFEEEEEQAEEEVADGMDGDIVLQIESGDKEELVIGVLSDLQGREGGMEIELAGKEGLTAVEQSDGKEREVGVEIELADKMGLTTVGQSDVKERAASIEMKLTDKEGLTLVRQSDVQERGVSMEVESTGKEGLIAIEQSNVQGREISSTIELADKEGLTAVEQSLVQEREVSLEIELADKEGLTAVEQSDMQEVQIGTEVESRDKEQLDAVGQGDIQEERTDMEIRSGDHEGFPVAEQANREERQSSALATSSAADIEATEVATPAPWITTLADNADGSQTVQIAEDFSKTEGDLLDQNKANYEFLLNLIGSLKKEIKQKNDELEDYKRKYDSPVR